MPESSVGEFNTRGFKTFIFAAVGLITFLGADIQHQPGAFGHLRTKQELTKAASDKIQTIYDGLSADDQFKLEFTNTKRNPHHIVGVSKMVGDSGIKGALQGLITSGDTEQYYSVGQDCLAKSGYNTLTPSTKNMNTIIQPHKKEVTEVYSKDSDMEPLHLIRDDRNVLVPGNYGTENILRSFGCDVQAPLLGEEIR
jgi:hypothetical protein